MRRAEGPVMANQVCGELGASTEPARSESMRAKLNRLAERDWLRKLAPSRQSYSSPHTLDVRGKE
ncbi:hypothetical protein ACFYZJ_32110 [Streptomyces sp. NPDC001848]|uniref:hypothetical protein n=1 Tax=Streptomyces sp. NPDC001848 TaxID=3364618 RepID=UPI0036B16D55